MVVKAITARGYETRLHPVTPAEPLGDRLLGSVIEFDLLGDPETKARPRMGRSGYVYTPRQTKVAEDAIRWQTAGTFKAPDVDHELEVELTFYCPTRQRKDLDNMVKLVLDALNGHAWGDDVQIASLIARRHYRSPDPRTHVLIRRTARWTIDCPTCAKAVRSGDGRRAQYCSRPCYDIAQRKGVLVPCVVCGTKVYRQASRLGRSYCPTCLAANAPQKRRPRAPRRTAAR